MVEVPGKKVVDNYVKKITKYNTRRVLKRPPELIVSSEKIMVLESSYRKPLK